MTPGEFAAIEARLAAATPGPWTVERWEDFAGKQSYYVDGVLRWREHLNTLSCEGDKDTAEFIAHAREDIPALLAAVRERDNTIARVRAIVESVHVSDDLDPDGYQVAGLIRAALDPQETP
ncbi:hypothetical protein [Rhodococcoides fascians]|uniref:hypothetical protein n=1 Tax=Rhodococcoides fascians TaxID=1828 RepID=UPI00050CE291|nr:hypothetical protein [Rhodococcus fascians]